MATTIAEQNKLQGQAYAEANGCPVVDGTAEAHKFGGGTVVVGNASPFPEAKDRPRDPQADLHGKSVLAQR